MLDPKLKERLAKLYELAKRGEQGERDNAQRLLDALLSKYSLDGIDLDSLDRNDYQFTYTSDLETTLLHVLYDYFIGGSVTFIRYTDIKRLQLSLRYLDYITLNCAYEYFRRHMKAQWNKTCAPELARCRKPKTRTQRRKALQALFISRYIIASNLYKEGDLTEVDLAKVSSKELADRMRLIGVQGGEYNRQVTGGLLLT